MSSGSIHDDAEKQGFLRMLQQLSPASLQRARQMIDDVLPSNQNDSGGRHISQMQTHAFNPGIQATNHQHMVFQQQPISAAHTSQPIAMSQQLASSHPIAMASMHQQPQQTIVTTAPNVFPPMNNIVSAVVPTYHQVIQPQVLQQHAPQQLLQTAQPQSIPTNVIAPLNLYHGFPQLAGLPGVQQLSGVQGVLNAMSPGGVLLPHAIQQHGTVSAQLPNQLPPQLPLQLPPQPPHQQMQSIPSNLPREVRPASNLGNNMHGPSAQANSTETSIPTAKLPPAKPSLDATACNRSERREHGWVDASSEESASLLRYPNGDLRYLCRETSVQRAWPMVQISRYTLTNGDRVQKLKCLGEFFCPVHGCTVVSRPKVPKERSNKAIAESCRLDFCPCHPTVQLVHRPCGAKMTITKGSDEIGSYVEVEHFGDHSHGDSHPIRPVSASRSMFEQVVRKDPQLSPTQLVVGSSSKEPVRNIDPAYKNIGRVREHQREVRKALDNELEKEVQRDLADHQGGLDSNGNESKPSNDHGILDGKLGDIAAVENQSNNPFLILEERSHNNDGGIVMQTAPMIQRLQLADRASEVDAIEGFLDDNRFPNGIVVVSSTYCSVMKKFTPTLVAILYGRSSLHFCRFFKILINGMDYADFQDFARNYKGMICDMSEAERLGFELAITDLFDVAIDEITIEQFYAYCQVHFLRSEAKFRRKHSNVPKKFKNDFKMRVRELLNPCLHTEDFWAKCKSLKQDYPQCPHWLDWHTSDKRARKIFPCLARKPYVGDHKNTNGQESMGKTIQTSFTEPKANLASVFAHLKRFLIEFDTRWFCALKGEPFDYNLSPTKPRKNYKNDGCPFQAERALVASASSKKKKPANRIAHRTGRPIGSTNVAPDSLVVTLKHFAVPWCVRDHVEDLDGKGPTVYNAINTCAMDSFLTGMAFLSYCDPKAKEYIKSCRPLELCVAAITNHGHNMARLCWMRCVLGNDIDTYKVKGEDLFRGTLFSSFNSSGRPTTVAETVIEEIGDISSDPDKVAKNASDQSNQRRKTIQRELTDEERNEVRNKILLGARDYDCSSSFTDNVRPALPDLFRFQYDCSYEKCSKDNCPNQEGYEGNNLSKPTVTQNIIFVSPDDIGDVQGYLDKEFNMSGKDNLTPCGSNLRGGNQGGAVLYSLSDKNGFKLPERMSHTCTGQRAETRTVLNTPNFLLVSIVVDAVETEEDISAIEFQSMGQAQYSIDFGGSKYSLKQVVVSSSTRMGYGHYCGIIVINGRLIFYDGIPSNNPQLRFISPEQRFGTLLHGGFISALVYMKLTPDCEFFLDPTTLKYGGYGSDDADPELEDCEESSAEDLVKALKMIATKCMKVQNRSKSSKVVSANNNHSSTKDLNTTKESNELAAKKLVEKNKVVDEKELVKPDFLSMWNDTAGPADKAGSPVVFAHKKNILKKAQSNSRSKKAKTEQGSPFAQKKKSTKAKRGQSAKPKYVPPRTRMGGKRREYPTGLSVAQVAESAKIPTCRLCRNLIGRVNSNLPTPYDSWHIVVRKKQGGYDRFPTNYHYHLDCVALLTKRELDQLKAIINRHEHISELDKGIWYGNMEYGTTESGNGNM